MSERAFATGAALPGVGICENKTMSRPVEARFGKAGGRN